jgi:hypothetical protein
VSTIGSSMPEPEADVVLARPDPRTAGATRNADVT